MNIFLTAEQLARLNTHVKQGEYASIEEAAIQLIDERIAERTLEEEDNLIWAKPYVDEALAAVANGETFSLEEHRDQIAIILAEVT